MPPRWALGYHQSRYSYLTSTEVRDVAAKLRADAIPAEVKRFFVGAQFKPRLCADEILEARKIGSEQVSWGPTLLSTVVAFAVGYAVIAWLLRWLMSRSYLPFVIYRVALGLLVMLLLATGVLAA